MTGFPAPILVTGVVGFIGSHVARRLIARGEAVVGIDNLNDYNAVGLKQDRLAAVADEAGGSFDFHRIDLATWPRSPRRWRGWRSAASSISARRPACATQSPIRAYAHSNLVGHLNLLELARGRRVGHLVYASSSSVYGTSPIFRSASRRALIRPSTPLGVGIPLCGASSIASGL